MCPLSKGHAPAIHDHPAGGGTAAGVRIPDLKITLKIDSGF
jgi:hypothetical protein